MNSMDKRQSSSNLPVFCTGLAENIKKEPKIPLLCILCGSSLANNLKSTDDSLKTDNYNGCEQCAKNFSNLKDALALLSNVSAIPPTPPQKILSPPLNDTNAGK